MPFEPVNDLERSLIRAATDPAHRPQFYRDFLASEIFAVQQGPHPLPSSTTTLHEGTRLCLMSLERDGRTIIAIFSSLPRLQVFIKQEETFISMKVREFLTMTEGVSLILNPGSDYGKEFTPQEIASLLDGSMWRPTDVYVTPKQSQVLIGQPANYPTELVAALARYFQSTPEVSKAYLAHFFHPERDTKPHTLIAIQTTGDWNAIASGAEIVARGTKIPDSPIDYFQITAEPGLSDHFRKSVKPFYEKK
jgi:hypothetical protein